MMGVIVVAGVPGVGKTSVLDGVAKKTGINVVIFGTVMYEIAKERSLVEHRDEIRKLPSEVQRELQEEAAERIRKIFEQKKFPVNGKYISTTVSGGISTYREDVDNIDTLIKEADIALYRAKKLGKNRIVIYKPGMESESSAEEGGVQGGTSQGS